MDANTVTAIFTTVMAIAACASAVYAFRANRKADLANINSSAANTLAGEANVIAETANTLATQANENSSNANSLADQALKISQGDSELLVHNSLSDALRRQDDAIIRYIEAKERYQGDETHFAVVAYKAFSDSAVQGYLNAFDIACQRYLDGKLDKVRFKKTYFTRIKELFNPDLEYVGFIKERAFTKYHALHAVNAEFHDFESQIA